MKKRFSTSLAICGLVAAICAQPVLANDFAAIDVATDVEAGTELPESKLETDAGDVVLGNDYETPVEITGGKLVALPSGDDLYKEGHVFVGWNTNPNATEGFFEYVMPNEDVTLYAIWAPVDGGKEEVPQCTCEPVDGVHDASCPLYEEPVVPEVPEVTPPTTDGTEQQPEQPETGEPTTPDAGQGEEVTPPTGPSEGDAAGQQPDPQPPVETEDNQKEETVPTEPDAGTEEGSKGEGEVPSEPDFSSSSEPVDNGGAVASQPDDGDAAQPSEPSETTSQPISE